MQWLAVQPLAHVESDDLAAKGIIEVPHLKLRMVSLGHRVTPLELSPRLLSQLRLYSHNQRGYKSPSDVFCLQQTGGAPT
jgi:hypothetical protein